MRDGARGCERRFVCAVMKDSLSEGTVGVGAAMAAWPREVACVEGGFAKRELRGLALQDMQHGR